MSISGSGEMLRPRLDGVMSSMATALGGEEYFVADTPPRFNAGRGSLEVFNVADVQLVQTDGQAISVYTGQQDGDPGVSLNRRGAWMYDQPEKDELLKPVVKHFGIRAAKRLTRQVEQIATVITTDIIVKSENQGYGRFNYTETLGELSLRVMGVVVGIPTKDLPLVRDWLRDSDYSPAGWYAPQSEEEVEYYSNLLEQHQRTLKPGAEPRDFMDELVIAQRDRDFTVGGRRFSDWLAVGQARMVAAAASDTTQTALGNILWGLSEHGVLEPLRYNRNAVPPAREEGLRRWAPFSRSPGVTKQTVLFGEGEDSIEVGPGQFVEGIIPAANFSRDVFGGNSGDSYIADFTRKPNPHRTYGGGWRACSGRYLANTIVDAGTNAVLDRLPALRVDESSTPEHARGIVTGILPGSLLFLFDLDKARQAIGEK